MQLIAALWFLLVLTVSAGAQVSGPGASVIVTPSPGACLSCANIFTAAQTFQAQILAAAGTVGAPSIGWISDADGTGTGLYRPAADQVAMTINGIQRFLLSASTLTLQQQLNLNGSSSKIVIGGAAIIGQDGSGIVQLGDDAATPVAQTLKSHDGSGTDKLGADLTLAAGNSTGTAAGGALKLNTTAAGGVSGSSQNTSTTRMTITAAGQVQMTALQTTGSAGSKNVVCVDTTTGQLYASSTGTDCSN